jgi:site-specific DNA-methyltransferase (adenine-specific)
MGRNYIELELAPNYVEISEQKLAKVVSNSKLGNYWVSFYLDKVATLRDIDWEYLQDFFHLPAQPEQIDTTSIILKSSVHLPTTPKHQDNQIDLLIE